MRQPNTHKKKNRYKNGNVFFEYIFEMKKSVLAFLDFDRKLSEEQKKCMSRR